MKQLDENKVYSVLEEVIPEEYKELLGVNLDKYINNVIKSKRGVFTTLAEYVSLIESSSISYQSLISGSFSWFESTEGFDFWAIIAFPKETKKEVLQNAFTSCSHWDVRSKAVEEMSKALFGPDIYGVLQLGLQAAEETGREDLYGRSFYIPLFSEIILHTTSGGSSVIEIKKTPNTMTYSDTTVSRSSMKELFEIACSEWRQRIINIINKYSSPLDNDMVLPGSEIKAMFQAATPTQMPVLEKIFGKDVDLNAFSKDLEKGNLWKFLHEANKELFNGEEVVELGVGAPIDSNINRPDLKFRSLYIGVGFKVILHKVTKVFTGTIIEIQKK